MSTVKIRVNVSPAMNADGEAMFGVNKHAAALMQIDRSLQAHVKRRAQEDQEASPTAIRWDR